MEVVRVLRISLVGSKDWRNDLALRNPSIDLCLPPDGCNRGLHDEQSGLGRNQDGIWGQGEASISFKFGGSIYWYDFRAIQRKEGAAVSHTIWLTSCNWAGLDPNAPLRVSVSTGRSSKRKPQEWLVDMHPSHLVHQAFQDPFKFNPRQPDKKIKKRKNVDCFNQLVLDMFPP